MMFPYSASNKDVISLYHCLIVEQHEKVIHFGDLQTKISPKDQWPECNEAMASLSPTNDSFYTFFF